MPEAPVDVSTTIEADAATLYDLVADLPGMGRWSPENSGGKWVGGANGPRLGARFRGRNRSGWRRWSTLATVTEAEPGKRFASHVTHTVFDIADWSYEFEPSGSGTVVTERWRDRRPGWFANLSKPVMGVSDRSAHNRATIEATLAALKAAAESRGGS